MMNTRDCLSSLELLRDFVARVVPLDVYMLNLIIDNIETSNKRLWALRESMRVDEKKFAALLGIPFDDYHVYERDGSPVPLDFLEAVADALSVSLEWLLCKHPILPMPEPRPKQELK
jgi:hypothetical protein